MALARAIAGPPIAGHRQDQQGQSRSTVSTSSEEKKPIASRPAQVELLGPAKTFQAEPNRPAGISRVDTKSTNADNDACGPSAIAGIRRKPM